MALRVRGVVMILVAVVGVVVAIFDGIDDGFSVWNLVSIVCFAVVLLYGLSYLSRSNPRL